MSSKSLFYKAFELFDLPDRGGETRAFRVSWLTAGGVFDFHRPFIFRPALAGWR